ncbi:Hypothetical protein CINCED_3A017813 [Cinara cedri]|uniref:Uncharacterized protein n=1 Tax=Cinara cedri TaxID=506608 RepID=A0A5E4MZ34_9HEMI|nr:Hypothetical protein CINCED_3A017813 [Cinara cedri]
MSQTKYLENLLHTFGMNKCKPILTPMKKKLKFEKKGSTSKPYHKLMGCLMYVMIQTRPDLKTAVNYFNRHQSKATDDNFNHFKILLRYLKDTISFGMTYIKNNNIHPLQGFVDADFANDINDRKSTSGYLYQVFDFTVSWFTRKQSTIAFSSTEAEYLALASAIQEGMWLKGLLVEMRIITDKDYILLHEDNQSCIRIANEPKKHQRLNHLDTKYNFIHEAISTNQIKLAYV